MIDELERLARLWKDGVLTDTEFADQKQIIFARQANAASDPDPLESLLSETQGPAARASEPTPAADNVLDFDDLDTFLAEDPAEEAQGAPAPGTPDDPVPEALVAQLDDGTDESAPFMDDALSDTMPPASESPPRSAAASAPPDDLFFEELDALLAYEPAEASSPGDLPVSEPDAPIAEADLRLDEGAATTDAVAPDAPRSDDEAAPDMPAPIADGPSGAEAESLPDREASSSSRPLPTPTAEDAISLEDMPLPRVTALMADEHGFDVLDAAPDTALPGDDQTSEPQPHSPTTAMIASADPAPLAAKAKGARGKIDPGKIVRAILARRASLRMPKLNLPQPVLLGLGGAGLFAVAMGVGVALALVTAEEPDAKVENAAAESHEIVSTDEAQQGPAHEDNAQGPSEAAPEPAEEITEPQLVFAVDDVARRCGQISALTEAYGTAISERRKVPLESLSVVPGSGQVRRSVHEPDQKSCLVMIDMKSGARACKVEGVILFPGGLVGAYVGEHSQDVVCQGDAGFNIDRGPDAHAEAQAPH